MKPPGGFLRWLVPGIPFLWLAAFFLLPFLIIAKISLSEKATARPPYTPHFDLSAGWSAFIEKASQLSFENYRQVFADPLGDWLYASAYLSSLRIAAIATLLTFLIAYPMALGVARASKRWRPALIFLVALPFWTSLLIRVYAWIAILKPEGFLNQALAAAGLIAEPLQIFNTETAVFIGIVYAYLPFMVLPIYAAIERQDTALREAAADLGAAPAAAFWRVTFPLSLPGVLAGCLLVFIPVTGEFVIPDLLGGSDVLMIGSVLSDEFFRNVNWPKASAVAVILLITLALPVALYQRLMLRAAGSA